MIDMIRPTKHTIHRYHQRTPMKNERIPNRSIRRVSPTHRSMRPLPRLPSCNMSPILSNHNTRFHRRIRGGRVSIQDLAIDPSPPHVQSMSYRPPMAPPSTSSHPLISWGKQQGKGVGAVHGSPNRRFKWIYETKDRDAKKRIGRNRANIQYRIIR